MGMIDKGSIYWQPLPDDTNNYISLKYDSRNMALNDARFNDAVVTG